MKNIMVLEFEVNNQLIKRKDTFIPVEKSENYLHVHFVFSQDWDGLKKRITFQREEDVIQLYLDSSDSCIVPTLINRYNGFFINLIGENEEHRILITTNEVKINILKTGETQVVQSPIRVINSETLEYEKTGEVVRLEIPNIYATSIKFIKETGIVELLARNNETGEEVIISSIDLPTERIITSVSYDETIKSLIFKFENFDDVIVPIGDIFNLENYFNKNEINNLLSKKQDILDDNTKNINVATLTAKKMGLRYTKPDGTQSTGKWNGNLVPDTDDTYDLGSNASKWQEVYAREIKAKELQLEVGVDNYVRAIEFDNDYAKYYNHYGATILYYYNNAVSNEEQISLKVSSGYDVLKFNNLTDEAVNLKTITGYTVFQSTENSGAIDIDSANLNILGRNQIDIIPNFTGDLRPIIVTQSDYDRIKIGGLDTVATTSFADGVYEKDIIFGFKPANSPNEVLPFAITKDKCVYINSYTDNYYSGDSEGAEFAGIHAKDGLIKFFALTNDDAGGGSIEAVLRGELYALNFKGRNDNISTESHIRFGQELSLSNECKDNDNDTTNNLSINILEDEIIFKASNVNESITTQSVFKLNSNGLYYNDSEVITKDKYNNLIENVIGTELIISSQNVSFGTNGNYRSILDLSNLVDGGINGYQDNATTNTQFKTGSELRIDVGTGGYVILEGFSGYSSYTFTVNGVTSEVLTGTSTSNQANYPQTIIITSTSSNNYYVSLQINNLIEKTVTEKLLEVESKINDKVSKNGLIRFEGTAYVDKETLEAEEVVMAYKPLDSLEETEAFAITKDGRLYSNGSQVAGWHLYCHSFTLVGENGEKKLGITGNIYLPTNNQLSINEMLDYLSNDIVIIQGWGRDEITDTDGNGDMRAYFTHLTGYYDNGDGTYDVETNGYLYEDGNLPFVESSRDFLELQMYFDNYRINQVI